MATSSPREDDSNFDDHDLADCIVDAFDRYDGLFGQDQTLGGDERAARWENFEHQPGSGVGEADSQDVGEDEYTREGDNGPEGIRLQVTPEDGRNSYGERSCFSSSCGHRHGRGRTNATGRVTSTNTCGHGR